MGNFRQVQVTYPVQNFTQLISKAAQSGPVFLYNTDTANTVYLTDATVGTVSTVDSIPLPPLSGYGVDGNTDTYAFMMTQGQTANVSLMPGGQTFFQPAIVNGSTILNTNQLLYSSALPAPNTLVSSNVKNGFTDSAGNNVLQGVSNYGFLGGKYYATNINDAGINFTVADAETSSWVYLGTIGPQYVSALENFINIDTSWGIGNALGTSITVTPSGDTSGNTDATVINAWLANRYAVNFLPGTYYVNVPIEMPGYGILNGAGRSQITKQAMTVIQAAVAMPAVIVSAGWLQDTQVTPALGVNVSNLKVNGNGLASNGIILQTSDSLIDHAGVENVLFQGIEFTVTSRHATATVVGSASNNRIESCSVNSCGGSGIATIESGGSVFTDGFIVDTIIAGTTAQGISIQKSAGWKIDGCHLYGLAQHGIQLGVMDNTRVVNNYIESWGQGATLGSWNAIDGFTLPTNVTAPSVIADNTIWLGAAPGNAGSTMAAISVRAATAVTASWVITSNAARCVPAVGFAAANAFVWSNQAASSAIIGVTTGNMASGNWNNAIIQNVNGGTITLTAGV